MRQRQFTTNRREAQQQDAIWENTVNLLTFYVEFAALTDSAGGQPRGRGDFRA